MNYLIFSAQNCFNYRLKIKKVLPKTQYLGGLLSPAAATESEKFTLSLVVGDDVIPRTSLPNISRLSVE